MIKFGKLSLVMLFENIDWSDVVAENPDVPFVAVEIGDRNAGIVLNDGLAVIENEIADPTETVFKHQIGRGFQDATTDTEMVAKTEKAGR